MMYLRMLFEACGRVLSIAGYNNLRKSKKRELVTSENDNCAITHQYISASVKGFACIVVTTLIVSLLIVGCREVFHVALTCLSSGLIGFLFPCCVIP